MEHNYRTFSFLFGKNIKNCLFKLGFGTEANSNMLNLMMMLTFLFKSRNNLYVEIRSIKSKVFTSAEILCLD